MIRRGWAKCGLEQVFTSTFQSLAMEEHMKTPLFKETPFELERVESSEIEEETDPDDSMEAIMEDGLVQVAEIITTNKKSTISSLNLWLDKGKFLPQFKQ